MVLSRTRLSEVELELARTVPVILGNTRFFRPTDCFLPVLDLLVYRRGRPDRHVYDIGAGVGHVAKMLSCHGFQVTAFDLFPRNQRVFPVEQAHACLYRYLPRSVLMFCRPTHDGFVESTIASNGQGAGRARAFLYVGFAANLKEDLGCFENRFELAGERVGQDGENAYAWRVR